MSALRPERPVRRQLADLLRTYPDLRSQQEGAGAVSVTGITHDSRSVLPGDLYAALPGARTHGAAFVAQALASGAAAVLTDPSGAEMIAAAGEAGAVVLEVPD